MAGSKAALLVAAALLLRGEPARRASPVRLQTSGRCLACHNGIATPSGEDVSIGFDWRSTMMANSARDPYWQAAVRREITDHPAARAHIEDECSKCHMPMARFDAKQKGREGAVFAHLPFGGDDAAGRLAADGVSCSLCHQIGKEKLGRPESFTGGFVLDPPDEHGDQREYGPYKIEAGQTRIMRSSSGGFRPAESEHIQQSEVCATCHTLYTNALGPDGKVIGRLPEQAPYQEWLHSDFRKKQSCQACHMPVVKDEVPVARVMGVPREGVSRHVFVGGNFFMLRMLNRYRGELNVAALPQELEAAAARTIAHLETQTARIAVERVGVRAGRLEMEVAIENLSGHKLPTAYPSRRAWLRLVVRDRNQRAVFESGAFQPNGSIQGNDNDAAATRFEPHYTEITAADQVQIYESIMGDQGGAPTTALLSAVRYLKDNRLLPRGFDKRTAAEDIAVIGGAATDEDFTGAADRVRYSVAVGDAAGPLQIEAELWFQPISYRWASNLRTYESAETRRFTAYYDSMSAGSAVVLARASATGGR
ncbi:MAG: hypothetical protein ACREF4_01310 [Gammaproteobacteria bacterium]